MYSFLLILDGFLQESGNYEGAGLAGFDDTVDAQRRNMQKSAQPAAYQSAQPEAFQSGQPAVYQTPVEQVSLIELCSACGRPASSCKLRCHVAVSDMPVLESQESWTRVSPYPGVESRPHQAHSSHNSNAAASQGSQSTMKQAFAESNYNPAETSHAAKIAAEAEAEIRSRGLRGKIRSALHKDSQ